MISDSVLHFNTVVILDEHHSMKNITFIQNVNGYIQKDTVSVTSLQSLSAGNKLTRCSVRKVGIITFLQFKYRPDIKVKVQYVELLMRLLLMNNNFSMKD